jgi:hypothetical protein
MALVVAAVGVVVRQRTVTVVMVVLVASTVARVLAVAIQVLARWARSAQARTASSRSPTRQEAGQLSACLLLVLVVV